MVIVAEDDLVGFQLVLRKEGDGAEAEIRRLGQDRKDTASIFVRADDDDIAALHVATLPLHDELTGEVLLHQQKHGADRPAEEQHEARHHEAVEVDTQRDESQAEGVDAQDLGCFTDLKEAVRVLVQFALVREEDEDEDVLERERKDGDVGVRPVVVAKLNVGKHP